MLTSSQSFCAVNTYGDGELVHEKKLIRFLDEAALTRRVQPQRTTQPRRRVAWAQNRPPTPEGDDEDPRLQWDSDEEDDGDAINPGGTPLKWRTLATYISALLDLYKEQVSLTMNSHPNPRSAALNAWIEDKKRNQDKQRRATYKNRGLRSLFDRYKPEELNSMMADLLGQPSKHGLHLRTRLDVLLGHFYVTRGESRRMAELTDLYPITFHEDEGPTVCDAAILTMSNGKTNKYGRVHHMGAIRHKNPLVCPVGALAAYLFYRWHCSDEKFPSFNRRDDWYNTKLLLGKDLVEPITYQTQREQITQLFSRCGISSTQKTHALRSSEPLQQDLVGTPTDEVSTVFHLYVSDLPLRWFFICFFRLLFARFAAVSLCGDSPLPPFTSAQTVSPLPLHDYVSDGASRYTLHLNLEPLCTMIGPGSDFWKPQTGRHLYPRIR